jgi:hypothetical protein
MREIKREGDVTESNKEDDMPLIAFLIMTAVILGVSIVGMMTEPSQPMLGEDSGYDGLDSGRVSIGKTPDIPAARRA